MKLKDIKPKEYRRKPVRMFAPFQNKEHMDTYLRHGEAALGKIYVKPKLVDLLKRHKEIQKQFGISPNSAKKREKSVLKAGVKEWVDKKKRKLEVIAKKK